MLAVGKPTIEDMENDGERNSKEIIEGHLSGLKDTDFQSRGRGGPKQTPIKVKSW